MYRTIRDSLNAWDPLSRRPRAYMLCRVPGLWLKRETHHAGYLHSNPLKNSISDRLFKNDEMQGARILRNEAYNPYVAMTKDEAQHGGSRFSTAR